MTSKLLFIVPIVITVGLSIFATWQATQIADRARAEIDKAQRETDEANQRFHDAAIENERLARIIAGYNQATVEATDATNKANEAGIERADEVSTAPSDWLDCPLPECVRNAFTSYCDQARSGDAASSPVGAVQLADQH